MVKAYSSYQVKLYDAETKKTHHETRYKKTSYNQYDGYNKVTISFKYQLISTETGQILLSDIIEKSSQSEVSYAAYKGNYKTLVPGDWKHLNSASTSDAVNTKGSDRRKMKRKFTANTKLTPITQIQSDLQSQIAKIGAGAILQFNPED
jgi:1,4-alpha-glucan branching enzyme